MTLQRKLWLVIASHPISNTFSQNPALACPDPSFPLAHAVKRMRVYRRVLGTRWRPRVFSLTFRRTSTFVQLILRLSLTVTVESHSDPDEVKVPVSLFAFFFAEQNFRRWRPIRENYAPRKFGAIRYQE